MDPLGSELMWTMWLSGWLQSVAFILEQLMLRYDFVAFHDFHRKLYQVSTDNEQTID
jgi:hypothetical protein